MDTDIDIARETHFSTSPGTENVCEYDIVLPAADFFDFPKEPWFSCHGAIIAHGSGS